MKRRKKKPMKPEGTTVKVMVENPAWETRHYSDDVTERFIQAEINVNESAITRLTSKGQLEAWQVAAADKFRRLFEQAGAAGAKAMDYTREPVDGGGSVDPISIRQLTADRELKRAHDALCGEYGRHAYRLVEKIAGEGKSIRDIAGENSTRRQRDTITDNLRTYLDCLAALWGYSNNKRVMRIRP